MTLLGVCIRTFFYLFGLWLVPWSQCVLDIDVGSFTVSLATWGERCFTPSSFTNSIVFVVATGGYVRFLLHITCLSFILLSWLIFPVEIVEKLELFEFFLWFSHHFTCIRVFFNYVRKIFMHLFVDNICIMIYPMDGSFFVTWVNHWSSICFDGRRTKRRQLRRPFSLWAIFSNFAVLLKPWMCLVSLIWWRCQPQISFAFRNRSLICFFRVKIWWRSCDLFIMVCRAQSIHHSFRKVHGILRWKT